jgi:hypothetical protein
MFTEHFFNALSHPDRLPCRFNQRLALWVASSANAKNFNILRRKNSYDGFFCFGFNFVI